MNCPLPRISSTTRNSAFRPRKRSFAKARVFYCLADGYLAFDQEYLGTVYENIGSEVGYEKADREVTARTLLALPGIGPWTASYVALRALGDPDAFLATDLGVRHALAALGLDGSPAARSEAWRPWRSYALMHLWTSLGDKT